MPTDPHEPTPTASDAREALPRHTTPTWEVELLISGVAVFAMLQLPGWLDQEVMTLRPRFDADWSTVILLLGTYLKGASIILAVTFALHLLLRAQWIALVGMHSVFADGIRWDRLRMGPVQREFEQQRYASREASIDRADNRATVVFAIGVTLATVLLLICAAVALALPAGTLVSRLSGWHMNAIWLPGMMLLLAGPLWLTKALDHLVGRRVDRRGWLHRGMLAMFRLYGRGISRGSDVMAILTSHGGVVRMSVLIFIVFMVVLSGAAFGLVTQSEPQALGNYGLFPDTSEDSGSRIEAAHYDDRRDPLRDRAVPYVQSMVISGPYVQLVVPFEPARDNATLRARCATALARPGAAERARATLDCLARLHPVALDGQPLSPRWDTGEDERTDRPVLRTMVDVRALAPGRHVLRIGRSPKPAFLGHDHEDGDSSGWVIAFWR